MALTIHILVIRVRNLGLENINDKTNLTLIPSPFNTASISALVRVVNVYSRTSFRFCWCVQAFGRRPRGGLGGMILYGLVA
jgi:hypothetical protein